MVRRRRERQEGRRLEKEGERRGKGRGRQEGRGGTGEDTGWAGTSALQASPCSLGP